jgi:hypothetical protein
VQKITDAGVFPATIGEKKGVFSVDLYQKYRRAPYADAATDEKR